VRDRYLVAAIAAGVIAAAGVAAMHLSLSRQGAALHERQERALADSTRFAGVLRARVAAEAKRDSILRQLDVIRMIDGGRFIWAHIMDEVSRALPPYTWLKSLTALDPSESRGTAAPTGRVAAPQAGDSTGVKDPPRFRLVGHTVDIQALTRFMRLLEASAFVQNVQMARSQMVMLDGKEVTEFTLEAQYEQPDRSVLTLVPVAISTR
jgi:Tfp pilus assembly protein PilN